MPPASPSAAAEHDYFQHCRNALQPPDQRIRRSGEGRELGRTLGDVPQVEAQLTEREVESHEPDDVVHRQIARLATGAHLLGPMLDGGERTFDLRKVRRRIGGCRRRKLPATSSTATRSVSIDGPKICTALSGSGCATARNSMISVCHRRRNARRIASGSGLSAIYPATSSRASRASVSPAAKAARMRAPCAPIASMSSGPPIAAASTSRNTSNSGVNVRVTCSANDRPSPRWEDDQRRQNGDDGADHHLDHAVLSRGNRRTEPRIAEHNDGGGHAGDAQRWTPRGKKPEHQNRHGKPGELQFLRVGQAPRQRHRRRRRRASCPGAGRRQDRAKRRRWPA